MKEKLTLLITLSITAVYVIGYMFAPIAVAASFTEQELINNEVITQPVIDENTQEEQEMLQDIQEIVVLPPSSEETVKEEVEPTIPQTKPEDISTEIWNILLGYGYSEIVAAGIMGNFVAEVGDPSTKEYNFDLDWKINTGIEIGLCQWTQGRRSAIMNIYGDYPSYEEQLEFMHNELTGSNGIQRQVTESQFMLIINATTPEDAAYYFALYFERCHKASFKVRQFKAKQAYEFFVG